MGHICPACHKCNSRSYESETQSMRICNNCGKKFDIKEKNPMITTKFLNAMQDVERSQCLSEGDRDCLKWLRYYVRGCISLEEAKKSSKGLGSNQDIKALRRLILAWGKSSVESSIIRKHIY